MRTFRFLKLVRLCASALLLAMICACAIVPASKEVTKVIELSGPGDSMVALRHFSVGSLNHVAMRSVLAGETREAGPRVRTIGVLDLPEKKVSWTVKGPEQIVEKLEAEWPVMANHLALSADQIFQSGWFGSGQLDLTLVFVDQRHSVDVTSRSIFVHNPSLTIHQFVNTESSADIEFAVISAISVMHHELVHLAARLGRLEFAGDSRQAAALNEEIFAYVVEQCSRFNLLQHFQVPSLTIRRNVDDVSFPNDWGVDPLDLPSITGRIISSVVLFSNLGDRAEFGREDLHLLLAVCAEHGHEPQDFVGWIMRPSNREQEAFRGQVQSRNIHIHRAES